MEHSKEFENAVKTYPVLNITKKLADEFEIKLVGHSAKKTRRGTVSQHLVFFINHDKVIESAPNQTFVNRLRNWKEAKARYNEPKTYTVVFNNGTSTEITTKGPMLAWAKAIVWADENDVRSEIHHITHGSTLYSDFSLDYKS
jgi:hypothetical protein